MWGENLKRGVGGGEGEESREGKKEIIGRQHTRVWILCCSVLQCVAMCCSVLQCVAALQCQVCDAVCCGMLKCVAVHYNVLQ